MKTQTRIDLCRQVFAVLDKTLNWRSDATSQHPAAAYCSQEWLSREKSLLFKEYPLLAGFSCDLPATGDFLTLDMTGVPVLLVRDERGVVNGFVNSCRHRGAQVARGCGNVQQSLSCPYHGWSYNLKGELKAIPDSGSFPGIDKSERPLIELPVVEKYGMLWVCPTPGADINIDRHLAGLEADFAAYDFGGYHPYAQRTLHCNMNWKLMLDTFLEPYHFAALHPTTVGPLFIANLCLMHSFGQNLREVLPRQSIKELRTLPEKEWDIVPHSAIPYLVFPNTVLVMQRDHAEIWRAFPAGDNPHQCRVQLDFYIPEPALTERARSYWEKNLDLTVRTVLEEDIPAVESIQAGLRSGMQSHSIFGRNEPALIHFHEQIARALGDAGR